MLCGCRILLKHALKRCHNDGRNLYARLLLAEIQLTDLIRCFRIDNDNARFIRNEDAPRLVDRDIREAFIEIGKPDRSGHNAGHRTVVQYRHCNNHNNLARNGRDDGFRNYGLSRLQNLFIVISITSVDRAVICIEAMPILLQIGHIGEDPRMGLDFSHLCKTCVAITAAYRSFAGELLQMCLVRLKDTPNIECGLLSKPRPNRLSIGIQHIACHLVADPKKDQKSNQHDRKNKCKEFCPN